jgi:hypothetical protein
MFLKKNVSKQNRKVSRLNETVREIEWAIVDMNLLI